MAKRKKKATERAVTKRPKRAMLSADESIRRMEEFETKRKEAFIAAVRKGKNRSVPA
jgi:hypothetical protein